MAEPEPRIEALNFKRQPGPRWAQMRVGMTVPDLLALGLPKGQIIERVHLGQIEFQPPITSKNGTIISKVEPNQPPTRPSSLPIRRCLCCGKPFRSAGPGNRLCDDCRRNSRSLSPYAPD